MKRPFDMSKLEKRIDKSITGISYGFNDPTTWMSTGCYALNYLASGRFDGGIPLEGKMTMFAGDSGSGKSYIVSGNIIKWCQDNNIWPIVLDTENALDESWVRSIGVDPNELEKLSGATVDDVAKVLGEVIELYREANDHLPYKDRPKMVIIMDSLGMLMTGNNEKQFMEGDLKGDMGIKAKQLTAMIRVCMAKIASQPIGIVVTNHVMDSQDQYQPDKIPGGKMLEFASSLIIQMNKYLLKEDEDGNKLTDGAVAGIRSTVVVRKSRYAKPFERVKIDIPYDRGMDPYSGLFDLFLKKNVIQKDGARWTYTSPVTGEVFKDFRKKWKTNGWLDQIMAEWEHWEDKTIEAGVDLTEGEPQEGE